VRITVSGIKADIGSIGGHICPSEALLKTVTSLIREAQEKGDVIDFRISHTGDDIAILATHTLGTDSEKVHRVAHEAFLAGTEVAKSQGLYGAGQDLLVDAFSGNIRGMGPAVAEMQFEERPGEAFLFFAADKTDPGAYNFSLYKAFASSCPGSFLSPSLFKGFKFTIMDVSYTEGDKVIELNAPEDLYDIQALLRDEGRFVVETIESRTTGEIVAAVSTTRLHNIAGKYVGKDDPIMVTRTQKDFPATGEILQPFAVCPYVSGAMRGSHVGPLTPVPQNSTISYFDGPPVVSCAAYSMKDGKLTGPADAFADGADFWEHARRKACQKAEWLREQEFFGVAMLPETELEYGGIVTKLKELEKRFKVRSR
jgi:fructose 1,6-bisphosphate aldolase/phosphatase